MKEKVKFSNVEIPPSIVTDSKYKMVTLHLKHDPKSCKTGFHSYKVEGVTEEGSQAAPNDLDIIETRMRILGKQLKDLRKQKRILLGKKQQYHDNNSGPRIASTE